MKGEGDEAVSAGLADRVAELEARLKAVADRCTELAREVSGDCDCRCYEADFLALARMCGVGGEPRRESTAELVRLALDTAESARRGDS